MKKQDTVILYSYFRKARVRQDFVGVMRQVACVRSPESIENPLCARVRRPLKKVDIQSQREIEWAVRQGIKSVSLHGVEATIEGKIAQS